MKYFIYARKSSEQEDRQILSLDSQEAELMNLAKAQKLEIVDVYKESGSAHVIGRKYFNEMITRIERHEASGLIVWDETRIARNSLDGGKVIYMMDLGQIEEIIKPGRSYKNTPDDKGWLGFVFTASKKESDDKSVNVKRGLKTKAEKGWLPSGAKPGYMNDKYADKGSKTILPDPMRYPLVEQAWDMMLTGAYTVGNILKTLNEEWEYRTPKHRKIGGKPMQRSQLYELLTDPFYYGEFEYPVKSGVWYKGKHKPMITLEEYDRVQMLLGRPSRPRPCKRQFGFTGLINCGECGSMITAEEKWQVICTNCKYKFASTNRTACPKCNVKIESMQSPKILHYIYYHCTKRKNKDCVQKSVHEKEIVEQIDNLLLKIQISEKFKSWAIKYLNKLNDKEVDNRNSIIKSHQDSYNDIVKRLDNLVALKISPQNSDNSLLTDEEFKNQKTTLLKEKERLSEQMNGVDGRIEKWVELTEKTFNFAIHAQYWFEKADLVTKREIFQSLGSNIKLKDDRLTLSLEKPFEIFELAKVEIPEIVVTFEPEEKSTSSIQLEALLAGNPRMLPREDSNL